MGQSLPAVRATPAPDRDCAVEYPSKVIETDPQAEAFYAHVAGGGKVEADDWMPDDYRRAVLKFVEMHANSELMGVLPEREWILRAPTLRRKLALTSKIQDEVGHAQLLYRVAEDLGKSRNAMLEDLVKKNPRSDESLRAAGIFLPWQADLLTEEFVKILTK